MLSFIIIGISLSITLLLGLHAEHVRENGGHVFNYVFWHILVVLTTVVILLLV